MALPENCLACRFASRKLPLMKLSSISFIGGDFTDSFHKVKQKLLGFVLFLFDLFLRHTPYRFHDTSNAHTIKNLRLKLHLISHGARHFHIGQYRTRMRLKRMKVVGIIPSLIGRLREFPAQCPSRKGCPHRPVGHLETGL